MSTKCTLAFGDSIHQGSDAETTQTAKTLYDFHFYREIFDERNVYLEMQGVDFTATQGSVTVAIPLAIWETIRGLGGVELPLAEKTDADLQVMAEADVAEFQAQGEANRAEQVDEALSELRRERDMQREIAAAIQALRERNQLRFNRERFDREQARGQQ